MPRLSRMSRHLLGLRLRVCRTTASAAGEEAFGETLHRESVHDQQGVRNQEVATYATIAAAILET